MKRRWAVTAISTGTRGRAVRLTVAVERDGDDHPGRTEEPHQAAYELISEAAGIYRRQYQDWPAETTTTFSELELGRSGAEGGEQK